MTKKNKLSLHRETLLPLQSDVLAGVHGGGITDVSRQVSRLTSQISSITPASLPVPPTGTSRTPSLPQTLTPVLSGQGK